MTDNNNSNTCPWVIVNVNNTGHCSPGSVQFDTGPAPSYVAILSCTFSCLGSILIILTFFILKDMRTGSQKIITLLAIADLISAVGYIVGSANYLHHRKLTDDCGDFVPLCVGQATVTSYSSLVSFLWTVILALYFFLIIVFKRVQVASNMMIFYNIVAWGGPLAIVIPLLALGRLGYSHFAASSWCFVKEIQHKGLTQDAGSTVIIFAAGKFWEILSYVLVSVLYIVIAVHISKSRRQMRNTVMEPRVVHVETRLLLIPIIFILLRIWGTIQFFFSLATSNDISAAGCIPYPIKVVFLVLGILQAIGDGGQGWGNAILYIFLSPVIRERLIGEWCGRCIEKVDDGLNRVDNHTEPSNTVQYRTRGGSNGGLKRTEPALNGERSSETVPILNGKRAEGYNARPYYSSTEGRGTGTDLSFT